MTYSEFMKGIGYTFACERRKKGWTQRQVALKTKMSITAIGNIEAGRTMSSLSLYKMCSALKLKPEFTEKKRYEKYRGDDLPPSGREREFTSDGERLTGPVYTGLPDSSKGSSEGEE